jgi:hypothetical protein
VDVEMGNDEFILYIRKRYPGCTQRNDRLGRQIWEWIQGADGNARKVREDQPCYWGDVGPFIGDDRLPQTAAQFAFSRDILPGLYALLDRLGAG